MSSGSLGANHGATECASVDPTDQLFCGSQSNPPDKPVNFPDLSTDQFFNPAELVMQLCINLSKSHTGLNNFHKSSLIPSHSCDMHETNTRKSQLWPVPPPQWRWSGPSNLGKKRRRRRKWLLARHTLLQWVVISLNWEMLGHPLIAPPSACVGASLSVQQHEILERLEDQLTHFLNVGPFPADSLGRAAVKFQDLIKLAKELPRCSVGVEDLESIMLHVHRGFDPYSAHFAKSSSDTQQPAQNHSCQYDTDICVPPRMTGSRPVKADRVKWDHPPSFEAEPFLHNELVRAAFRDPDVLRKPEDQWPVSKPAKVHCDRKELLALAERWDSLGACRLIPAASKDFAEAVGLFVVPKDTRFDRLIVNPTTINSRMHKISDSTKSLAPGCMLTQLSLSESECFRFSADDLTDFYYTFRVSPQRASRNAIRMKFQSWEVEHLSCFDSRLVGQEVLICLASLAMGDSLAVEVAQQSHLNVLKKLCGSMLEHESLRYRAPCPRGDFVELLAIDDHVGLQKLPLKDLPKNPELRDTTVFKSAELAYKHVGLVQHERKRKRNLTSGVILGADFDGIKGRVMAPRDRIIILSMISSIVAMQGTCTLHLLSMILGSWISVLLFRRPLFSLISSLFKEGQNFDKHKIFCLSRQSRNELQLLSVLGSMAFSDLRAKYHHQIFSTDASPWGAAVVAASVEPAVSRELWRHCEQKGYYTKLLSPASTVLTELGMPSAVVDSYAPPPLQHDHGDLFDPVPPSLEEGVLFDCVEIFRGDGCWSQAHKEFGLHIHDGFDIDGKRLRVGDLLRMSTFRELVSLALRGAVKEWHCGMPCLSFGTLRRPQVRSLAEPFGFNCHDPFTAKHNTLAIRSAIILILAVKGGQFISVEQPLNSRLFRLELYKVLVMLGCVISKFAFCAHGSGFNKRSKWLHNKPWLLKLESRCVCPSKECHFRIEGTFTRESIDRFCSLCRPSCQAVYGRVPKPGEAVSAFSAGYPLSLVMEMASGSKAARSGQIGKIPLEYRMAAFRELDISMSDPIVWPANELPFPQRQWHEDPEWIGELCDSLEFRELFRYRFKRSGHINVNETRTYKSWMKCMAKSFPSSRFVGILDSRVTLGAAAKGRSSSFAISRVLQGTLGYIIGGNLYPGGLHCYSHANRADEPSRDKPVRGPSKKHPVWLSELAENKPARFDLVRRASCFQKNPSGWLRLLLLLAGDIEPNPGPRFKSYVPRGALDLRVGFEPQTANRMERCLEGFSAWVTEHAGLDWNAVKTDPRALALSLRGYGMFCFERGLPRYLFVYAITAVQDQFPESKQFMNVA